ncbi:MAG TPA: AraC family transcriptional regulator [Blastocatellia bacterium]
MILTLDNRPGKPSAESQAPNGGAKPGVWQMSHVMLGTVGGGHNWTGEAALSIKSFSGGQAYYNAGGGSYLVDANSYLILNHDQKYTIHIEPGTPIVSFCLFFAEGFAEEIRRSLNLGANRLLDEPEAGGQPTVNFFERTYLHDELLSPALAGFRAELLSGKNDPGWVNEQLHDIAARLLAVHQLTRREVEALPAVRPATREELYRRLHRARDFIAASATQNVPLEEVARVACLSPNHLLRNFKQLFGQTPHQYLTAQRLQHAARLLRQPETSVTEICLAVGFESLGSFSTLFRRHTGLSPDAYRRQKRLKQG